MASVPFRAPQSDFGGGGVPSPPPAPEAGHFLGSTSPVVVRLALRTALAASGIGLNTKWSSGPPLTTSTWAGLVVRKRIVWSPKSVLPVMQGGIGAFV